MQAVIAYVPGRLDDGTRKREKLGTNTHISGKLTLLEFQQLVGHPGLAGTLSIWERCTSTEQTKGLYIQACKLIVVGTKDICTKVP